MIKIERQGKGEWRIDKGNIGKRGQSSVCERERVLSLLFEVRNYGSLKTSQIVNIIIVLVS